MWNAGYNFGEHQNGYGYNNVFNSYQQGNRYSDFYEQQQPDLYPDYYQQSSLEEPYFTSPQQFQQAPVQNQSNVEVMLKQIMDMMSSIDQRQEILETQLAQMECHPEMPQDEGVVEEEIEESENLEKTLRNRSVLPETDRSVPSTVNPEFPHFGTDRFEARPIGFAPKFSKTLQNDTETDLLPPEATPNVDSTCLDSFEDDTHSYNEVDHLIYALLMGEELTREHRERALEIIRTADTHVLETETIESEPSYNEELHHEEPSSSPTCVDLRFEQSKEANHTSSVENSILVQRSENQQLLVVDQASVELSNKRKLELPSAKTCSETPLLKRHSNTSEHLLGKESVWGRKKNFELTGEGDYGGYRDQFYIDPGSSTGGIRSRNEYHGPWFND